MKRAKNVATIGPATSSSRTLESLIKSGVDVFRLIFSPNTFEEHQKLLMKIRRASTKLKRHHSTMQDLLGQRARVRSAYSPIPLPDRAFY